eukprot:TRINITY_DN2543_c0_g1_i1.p1 TRINITY_DN2543_c0_g1~~TRINITY_DN2543_c0_g1_i1.p1  ORF type:complete len:318 (+),score=57.98 TRINITY_DN2543_c0_g1_i1:115-1068(+)
MWKKPHATSSFSLKDGTKDKWKVITTHKGDDGHEWTLVHPRYQVQKYHGKMPISPFRIVLSRNDFTLATSKDLAPLLTECWMYLTDKIPTLMPETVQEKDEESVLWIVSHINELHLAAGQHHSGKKGHTADSPSLKVSNDAKVFKELEESVDYSELGSDVELESVSSSDLAARDSLESFRLGEISTSRQFLTASTTAVEGDSKKTSLKFWKKDSDSALNTSASIVVDEKKAQKDVKDGEEETDESLYISVVLFFQALFHEDATREQRTQKYCIMLAVFTEYFPKQIGATDHFVHDQSRGCHVVGALVERSSGNGIFC